MARQQTVLVNSDSIRREKASRFLGIVASAVIKLGRAGLAMAGRTLHVIERRAVFEGRGDKVVRIERAEPPRSNPIALQYLRNLPGLCDCDLMGGTSAHRDRRHDQPHRDRRECAARCWGGSRLRPGGRLCAR